MPPDLSYIHPALQHLAVPIGSLQPDPDNARKHDEVNQRNVRNSLKQWGQRLPIVVQKQGMIIRVGNNRWAQAKALGWTHIAVVTVDEGDVEAMAYALTDNRSAEVGATWDVDVLSLNMQAIADAIASNGYTLDLDSIGWSQAEQEALLGSFDVVETAMPNLATAEDRSPIQQITFTLADVQAGIIKQAVERAQAAGHGADVTGGNPNKNGNAIAFICEQWLALVDDDGSN